ncbi:hypothetical protein PV10_02593 [Exophiala mesophila]|uniref:Uncharacterized protein n=1 Tax=Exophiala mesophila TaxID=212818 RepID=A0A0D1ZJR6_EXOME|nr:uncharacterized protein PV10_02593 [Exophiala mesophila]KIV94872.1 hypothetical protein PV10_02593 [Exophiala mesophila]
MASPVFERFSAPARIQRLGIFAVATLLLFVFFESSFFPEVPVPRIYREAQHSTSDYYLQWGPFEPMQIPGFVNTGMPGKRSCDALKYNSTVGVQKSFFLTDDIQQIAMSLDSHPIVDYPDDMMNDPNLKVTDIVDKTWARLSGSSVWLPEQEVYLSVTRVIFCPTRVRSVPKMSFLRGQLLNKDWEHLDNYNITWGEKTFNFPLVFDVPAQWEQDGSLYGPEDPRIILEDGVEGAEPVIIFNMIGKRSDWKRAMYIFRPFSNFSTILTIRDTERQFTEKNWAPFFVPQEEPIKPVSKSAKLLLKATPVVRKENEYIHFIYSFKPLKILKCHLRCGDCEIVYEQEVPENFANQHREEHGSLRGGTNFVPVPIPAHMRVDPRVRVYASFPRTNIERHCDGSFYRPEFVVMVMIGDQFHMAFASESLDFGNSILELGPEDDRCGKGRILIPNSIAHWDTSAGQDIMSITFSVNDETVQVARVEGILKFVQNLPQFKTLFSQDGPFKGADSDLMNMLSSWVGDDIRGCLVEAALNYTETAQEITNPKDEEETMDPNNELLYKIHQEEEEEEEELADFEGDDIFEELSEDDEDGIPDLEGDEDLDLDADPEAEPKEDDKKEDDKKEEIKKEDEKKAEDTKADEKKDEEKKDEKKVDDKKDEGKKVDEKKNQDKKKEDEKKDAGKADEKKEEPKKDDDKKDEDKKKGLKEKEKDEKEQPKRDLPPTKRHFTQHNRLHRLHS